MEMVLCWSCGREARYYVNWVIGGRSDTDYTDAYACEQHLDLELRDGYAILEKEVRELPQYWEEKGK